MFPLTVLLYICSPLLAKSRAHTRSYSSLLLQWTRHFVPGSMFTLTLRSFTTSRRLQLPVMQALIDAPLPKAEGCRCSPERRKVAVTRDASSYRRSVDDAPFATRKLRGAVTRQIAQFCSGPQSQPVTHRAPHGARGGIARMSWAKMPRTIPGVSRVWQLLGGVGYPRNLLNF
jgi:hypothetical protein